MFVRWRRNDGIVPIRPISATSDLQRGVSYKCSIETIAQNAPFLSYECETNSQTDGPIVALLNALLPQDGAYKASWAIDAADATSSG